MEAAHKRGRLAHAFLISGARGSGKEALTARIIQLVNGAEQSGGGFDLFGEAVAVETPPLDDLEGQWVHILRPRMKSRRIAVDAIRDLERPLRLTAPEGKWKVGVVAEADRMGVEASNAFLKTLEEPPDRTLLLLLTSNPQALLPTILSRCVRLPLLGGVGLEAEGGHELVGALDKATANGLGSPRVALTIKAIFGSLLEQRRETANAAAEAALKEEEQAYKQVTEGDWLKRREEFHKAAAESEYLEARGRLFDVLTAWMADVLRVKAGSGGLDFPDSSAALQRVAGNETEERLLKRMDALETLRRSLDTNAQEQLALEVGFLRAFG
ncbi:DNA polymerase III subunit delta' [Luteolibacter sp. LG18]|nr:DNA polymerase III subunit delta' [Luteolibacter sp. LG18]